MKYRIVPEADKYKIQFKSFLFWRDYKTYGDYPEPRFKTYLSTRENCEAMIDMLKELCTQY